MEEKKTYLITLHNEGELRPTLGFLTSFVFLEIEKGRIKMEFHDSYDITPPPQEEKIRAPEIIERRFSQDPRYEGWVFRDSNFSPEFSQNAIAAIDFLQYDSRYADKKIDGVLGINLYALGEIIDSVGGISFEGEEISSHTLFALLEKEAKSFDRHSEKEWLSRKNSFKPIATILLQKIAFSPLSWKSFSNTIETLGEEKHFLFFSPDEDIQDIFSKKQWTGGFLPPKDSFVMGHTLANIGGKKGDRYIRKYFFSTFSVSPQGKNTEKLRILFQHEGTRNLHSDKYFGHLRIYRPKGTTLSDFAGEFLEPPLLVQHSSLPNVEEFEFFFEIDESTEKTFSLEFTHSQKIKNPSQEFFIFSQAGKTEENILLTFQAEADASFVITPAYQESQSCEDITKKENISSCSFQTAGNKSFILTHIPDNRAPLLEEIILLEEGKKIRIQFSEEIQYIFPSSVVIQEKQTGEKILIRDVAEDKRSIIVELEKNLQKDILYTLHIDEITDNSGNTLSPLRTGIKRKK